MTIFLAILIMAHLYSRNRNRYRYRGRIPCFLVDFGPDPDLDPDSGCHNLNCCDFSAYLDISPRIWHVNDTTARPITGAGVISASRGLELPKGEAFSIMANEAARFHGGSYPVVSKRQAARSAY
jgi:hypothetical protein